MFLVTNRLCPTSLSAVLQQSVTLDHTKHKAKQTTHRWPTAKGNYTATVSATCCKQVVQSCGQTNPANTFNQPVGPPVCLRVF